MRHLPLKVQIENFRAINHAHIQIDDITVIAGVNGSGKSTISKFTYQVLKTAVHFDELVESRFKYVTKREMQNTNIIISELFSAFSSEIISQKMLNLKQSLISITKDYSDELPSDFELTDFIKKFEELSALINEALINNNEVDQTRLNRIRDSLSLNNNERPLSIAEMLQIYLSFLKHKIRHQKIETIRNREIRFADIVLNQAFEKDAIFKSINVFESDVPILDRSNKRVSQLLSVNNVIYIDTPMMFGAENKSNSHWGDLEKILRKKSKNQTEKNLVQSFIQSEILEGEIREDNSNFFHEGFVYKRKDGSVFDLLECATGLKSFAIIQLLLQRGLLTDKTLLIIDEPEAHLHPQWVVEYARLMVLLNKEIGVRFLIASHHPEMVSAIKYISEKEKPNAGINFYLAEQSKNDTYCFDYKHLGTDIEPIFASFNSAFERIDEYGETQQE